MSVSPTAALSLLSLILAILCAWLYRRGRAKPAPAASAQARRRSRALLKQLRHARAALDALPGAIVLLDTSRTHALWFNQAAAPLLGLASRTDIGCAIAQRLPSLQLAEWLASPAPAPRHNEAAPQDPSQRLKLSLLHSSQGQPILLAQDVSRLLRLEDMRRDFVATVSHELRTPLTVLHGYLEMLEGDAPPEWQGIVPEMQKQSQRMKQLVDDLLTLSRLDAAQSTPAQTVPMAPLLQSLLREAEGLAKGRQHIRLHDMAGLDLLGTEKELHSAFSNLISNAVRYTPEGGHIDIRFEPLPQGGAVFSVTDNGYGIAPQHLPRLTERFYRVSQSRTRESGGTGLGLAICKHALNLHDARLEIDSQLGQGSTFRCIFPATRCLMRPAPLS
ncbi:MAG: phosphate regulon sensor histidine kinase PhoR [Pseudomonadota bacterium]|nr:phosphate regulon sensor histidine kinase PhoR [Pseudomonadota bacterium]